RQPMAPETQPLNVFKRVFGDASMTGTDFAKILAQKKSVLDHLRGSLARMQALVPASERDRLATHAGAISQLEGTLQQTYGSMGGAGGAGGTSGVCTKPAMPPSFT